MLATLLSVASALRFEADISPDTAFGWSRGARASPSAEIELIVAVRQPASGVAALKAKLHDVSDPNNKLYGQHLSNERVHELVAPSATAISTIKTHFGAHNLVPLTPNADLLSTKIRISDAEALLGCEYYEYHHADGANAIRTPAYALPDDIAPFIDLVAPTVRLPPPPLRPRPSESNALFNTPNSLRALYSVGETVGKSAKNKLAVTGFLGQHYSPSDLQKFYKTFFPSLLNTTLASKGDDAPGGFSGVEAMLDAEYASTLGAGVASEWWGFTGRAPNPANEPFLKWLGFVSNTSDDTVPRLFSTSYGEPEISVSTAYADRINVEFVKAGTRGISLLFASGDSGASCVSGKFTPNWPAASPYITSVGGTQGTKPEAAVGLSSGGFSNRYGIPTWQAKAVATYLSTPAIPDRSMFNVSGRGFPDIAAQAVSYLVTSNGFPMPVDGTSCASPTAGGIISLLNDLRLQAGKPSLGFLNPFLYNHAAALNDITTGANGGCSRKAGFGAVTGWDPVTGLGTPNYTKLAAAVQALP